VAYHERCEVANLATWLTADEASTNCQPKSVLSEACCGLLVILHLRGFNRMYLPTHQTRSLKNRVIKGILRVTAVSCALFAIGFSLLAGAEVMILKDRTLLNGLLPPTDHSEVAQLFDGIPRPVVSPCMDSLRDFDGDGVNDILAKEYYEMRPILSHRTMGLVSIHSGASGKLLLSHAILSLGTPVEWIEDWDENGTVDILISEREGWTILGHTR